MHLTVVCPRGHSIQATSDDGGRQIRCPVCQEPVTIPASGQSLNQRAAATRTFNPEAAETVASAEIERTAADGPSRRQPVARRLRLAGLAACVLAAGVVAAIIGLVWRKSRNQQPQTPSSHAAIASEAGARASGADARSTPIASPEPEDRYPRLPGAVHRLPDWLARECPFDTNEFSPEIPWDENAAPLYLEAIAEFSAELSICFPPDR